MDTEKPNKNKATKANENQQIIDSKLHSLFEALRAYKKKNISLTKERDYYKQMYLKQLEQTEILKTKILSQSMAMQTASITTKNTDIDIENAQEEKCEYRSCREPSPSNTPTDTVSTNINTETSDNQSIASDAIPKSVNNDIEIRGFRLLVSSNMVPLLIGKKGRTINRISQQSGASIFISGRSPNQSCQSSISPAFRLCVIDGTLSQIIKAIQRMIDKIAPPYHVILLINKENLTKFKHLEQICMDSGATMYFHGQILTDLSEKGLVINGNSESFHSALDSIMQRLYANITPSEHVHTQNGQMPMVQSPQCHNMDMTDYYSVRCLLDEELVGGLIGKCGRVITKLRQETCAKIHVSDNKLRKCIYSTDRFESTFRFCVISGNIYQIIDAMRLSVDQMSNESERKLRWHLVILLKEIDINRFRFKDIYNDTGANVYCTKQSVTDYAEKGLIIEGKRECFYAAISQIIHYLFAGHSGSAMDLQLGEKEMSISPSPSILSTTSSSKSVLHSQSIRPRKRKRRFSERKPLDFDDEPLVKRQRVSDRVSVHNIPRGPTKKKIGQRQWQIDQQKESFIYQRYRNAVPKHLREANDPKTPNPRSALSIREWKVAMNEWREDLRHFDLNECVKDEHRVRNEDKRNNESRCILITCLGAAQLKQLTESDISQFIGGSIEQIVKREYLKTNEEREMNFYICFEDAQNAKICLKALNGRQHYKTWKLWIRTVDENVWKSLFPKTEK